MGAWNYGPLDNDAALDVKAEFEKKIEEGNSPAEALRKVLESRGESVKYGCEFELIALLQISLERNIPLKVTTKKTIGAALNRELTKERLAEWDSPTERKKVLFALLKKIGA